MVKSLTLNKLLFHHPVCLSRTDRFSAIKQVCGSDKKLLKYYDEFFEGGVKDASDKPLYYTKTEYLFFYTLLARVQQQIKSALFPITYNLAVKLALRKELLTVEYKSMREILAEAEITPGGKNMKILKKFLSKTADHICLYDVQDTQALAKNVFDSVGILKGKYIFKFSLDFVLFNMDSTNKINKFETIDLSSFKDCKKIQEWIFTNAVCVFNHKLLTDKKPLERDFNKFAILCGYDPKYINVKARIFGTFKRLQDKGLISYKIEMCFRKNLIVFSQSK